MAQATFIPFVENDAPTAALTNATFTGISTASSGVDGTNIRIEGLDRNSIDAGATISRGLHNEIVDSAPVVYGDGAGGSIDITGGYVAVQDAAGNPLRISNGAPGFSFDPTTQDCIVRASVEIRRFTKDAVGPTAIQWGFALYYKFLAGAATRIDCTYRAISWDNRYLAIVVGDEFQGSGSFTICHNLYISAVASPFDWIELRVAWLAGAAPDSAIKRLYLSESQIELTIWDH